MTTVLDDCSTGDPERLLPVRDRIRVVEGSILDSDTPSTTAMGGGTWCSTRLRCHSVARSLAALASNEVNVTGTGQVMLGAAWRPARVVLRRFLVRLRHPRTAALRRGFRPDPESPYGVSEARRRAVSPPAGRQHRIATVALRYFSVFGEGRDASGVRRGHPRFITAVLTGQSPTVNGDGVSLAGLHPRRQRGVGEPAGSEQESAHEIACNIACGERFGPCSMLLEAIQGAAGRRVEPVFGPPRPGDIKHSMADISPREEALGYEVVVPFDEGVHRAVSANTAGVGRSAWLMSGRSDEPARPSRIAIVIGSMGAGGAERVTATLAEAWAAQGRDVHIVTVASGASTSTGSAEACDATRSTSPATPAACGRPFARPVSAAVPSLHLGSIDPDVVVGMTTTAGILSIVASSGRRWRVVVEEHIHPPRCPPVAHGSCCVVGPTRGPLASSCSPRRASSGSGARCRRQGMVIPNPIAYPVADAEPVVIPDTLIGHDRRLLTRRWAAPQKDRPSHPRVRIHRR
ncbi:MAG: glycosyltransferase [Chloroflexota bacterium]